MPLSRRQLLGTGSVAAGSALTGCLGSITGGNGSGSDDTITFGMTTALSGALSGPGARYLNGFKIWLDKVKQDGGILDKDVELIHYDDESTPDRSLTMYKRLVDQDNVDFLIGPFGSGLNYSAANVSVQNEIPMVTGGGSDPSLYERELDHFYGIHSKTTMYGVAFPQYLAESIDWGQYDVDEPEVAAVIYAEGAYTTDMGTAGVENFKEYGFDVASEQQFPADLKDFSNIINRIKDADPDVLAVYGYPQSEATFATQAKESDLNVDIHYQNYSGTQTYSEALGDQANYTFTGSWWDQRYDIPGVDEIVSMWRERNDSDWVPMETAWGPAVGKLYKSAIENAGSTNPEDVNTELRNLDIETVVGRVEFHQEQGHNLHQYKFEAVRQWQDNERALLAPPEFTDSTPWLPTPKWSNRSESPSDAN